VKRLKLGVSSDTTAGPWLYYDSSLQTATLMAESTPKYGFVAFAETWNGRLAMLGFVIGLGTELLTGQSILGQIGLG
jgi:ferrochelatase